MQVIPALDLLGDDAVRLEQGDFERVLFRQPLEEFMARIVATAPPLIHIVDLQGARDGALRPEVVAAVRGRRRRHPPPGLGRHSFDLTLRSARWTPARRGSSSEPRSWEGRRARSSLRSDFGEHLLVALDVRDGRIAVRGWTESSGLDVDEALARCRDAGVVRLHVTAIDRDGTMRGPDLDLYRQVCASGLAVVAAGGVRDDDDVAALAEVGCEAAVMGVGYLTRLGLTLDS